MAKLSDLLGSLKTVTETANPPADPAPSVVSNPPADPAPPVVENPPVPPSVPVVASNGGKAKYKVELKGQPAEVVEAKDRLDAIYAYNSKLGIISTTNEYSVTEVAE